MSYEGKSLLRDADGVPIPQYWDDVAEEFKPMGKPSFDGEIVLESSPENPVNTEDQALLSELEEVKTELESVRNKLNEQEYEDGAALTKLTGSNVEFELYNNRVIGAGSAYLSDTISHSASKLFLLVKIVGVSATSDFGVEIRYRFMSGAEVGYSTRTIKNVVGDSTIVEVDTKTPKINVRIANNSDEDLTFRVALYAIGGDVSW